MDASSPAPAPTPPASTAPSKPVVRTIDSWFRIPGPPWVRFTAYFFYYLAILIGLMLIYGKGDFTTTPFIYQGF